jgi:excinuclease ABC subunit A
MQTGANPASLLANDEATLQDGVLLLWPNLKHKVAAKMLDVFSRRTGIPLDVPFQELAARERRILFHGTGDAWYEVHGPGRKLKNAQPIFRFQFKGIYPAIDEAARLSPALRGRLSHLVGEVECSACGGSRLRDDASATRLRNVTMDQLCQLPLARLHKTIAGWRLSASEKRVAGELIREIRSRTKFLNDVGLGYLTLARTAASLSGGEAQRIRLASQLGSGLCGVLYVLDEPTIGLHPRDNKRLIGALHGLRDLGNTLILVEHDREVIAGSDNVLDFGPRAGKQGGQVVAQGSPDQLTRCRDSVTGPYLSGAKAIPVPSNRRYVGLAKAKQQKTAGHGKTGATSVAAGSTKKSVSHKEEPIARGGYPPPDWLTIRGARHHNLKNIDVRIPLGRFTTVTGPSGSGKSSLLDDVLYAELARRLHRANIIAGGHDTIEGIEHINKVIRVDQQPLGNSPTSNPATYTGAFEYIRKLFSYLPESRLRGYSQRRFSFNAPGGRCEECEGNGQLCIEMHFLPDVWVTCDACHGARYNQETLQVLYHGRSIAEVLDMTCGDAAELFANIPKIRRILQTLCDVGLNYLTLGQPAPTLSGGEAQRVKLASELSRPDTGRTLYLLDEPTTGLHFDDLSKLLDVLHRLVDLGNTVVVIEHNSDVIKSADWVVDMGPEAGADGGQVVAAGTPEDIVRYARATRRRKPPANGATNGSAKMAGRTRQDKSPHQDKSTSTKKPATTCLVESGLYSHTGEAQAPCCKQDRLKSDRSTHRTRLKNRPVNSTSNKLAAKRRCHGKSTGMLGTQKTVLIAKENPYVGTVAYWPLSSTEFTNWANSAKRIGIPAQSSRYRPQKKATAGSCTRSQPRPGC